MASDFKKSIQILDLYFQSANERGAMRALIKHIAQALVDNPKQVTVTEIKGNNTSVLELKVAKEDVGKVIGKHGRTAQAMRTILNAVSAKERKHRVLEILE